MSVCTGERLKKHFGGGFSVVGPVLQHTKLRLARLGVLTTWDAQAPTSESFSRGLYPGWPTRWIQIRLINELVVVKASWSRMSTWRTGIGDWLEPNILHINQTHVFTSHQEVRVLTSYRLFLRCTSCVSCPLWMSCRWRTRWSCSPPPPSHAAGKRCIYYWKWR